MGFRPRKLCEAWVEPERELVPYAAARLRMRSGDILRFVSDCALGYAIRFFRPGGSHAAVVLDTRIPSFATPGESVRRLDMAEADERGFVPLRLSRVLSQVVGRVFVHQLELAPPQLDKVNLVLDRMIKGDIAYNYKTLLELMFTRPRYEHSEVICSEGAVYPAICAGALPAINWCPTPGDLVGLPFPCFEIDIPSVKDWVERNR